MAELTTSSDPSLAQEKLPPEGRKRKASHERPPDDDEAKPQRPSHHDSTQITSADRNEDRKRKPVAASVQDEKKRNKRLFGGLLSTLSQSAASNPAQKRRLEIERRQQERLQKQKDEDERLRRERGGRRVTTRSRDGISWEEEKMKNRHRRMLGQARFLRTRARPTVYYLPAKRSTEHDERIEEQIRSTQRLIEREEDEFEERRRAHEEKQGSPRLPDKHPEPQAPREPHPPASGPEGAGLGLKKPTSTSRPAEEDNTHGDHEESGDEVMDAEEDMVIY